MKELKDYSGEFKADLKLQDFSKDTLVKAWSAASRLFIGQDGLWTSVARDELGEKKAFEMARKVWGRSMLLEQKNVKEAMNIEGKDVATLFKCFQCDPGAAGVMELEFDLKNKSHGIMTVRRCLSLDYFERHNDMGLLKLGCHILDAELIPAYALNLNPKIKSTCLQLPPRKSKDQPACRWEFEVES